MATPYYDDKDDQQSFMVLREPRPYHYFEQQVVSRIHHFYISQAVEEPSKYVEMIHIIQVSGPDSVIFIHLNTPGGALDTGIQLVNAMQSSNAHIVCSLEGQVASLGTMIFLAADEFVVHDNCLMMFHNYSGGVFGKGHEQIAALEATTRWVEEIMKRLYVPFMSEEEFERVKRGEDLYFHSEEVRKRLARMVKILEKEKKDQQLAEEAPKPRAKRSKKSEQ